MGENGNYRNSEPVTVFHGLRLPEPGFVAGYGALVDAHELQAPLPRQLIAIGQHHRIVTEPGWRLLTPRHAPDNTLAGHLVFALKWEGLDLTILKRLFQSVGPEPVAGIVRSQPTGTYARRIWFLYEWLTGERLPLPDAEAGRYVDVVDPKLQFGGAGERSSRHRVRNNLPGSPFFCPLVYRTEALARFLVLDLAERAREVVARVPGDVIARAAAFLLLSDSKSSFAIEGERPPADRIERWGRAIGQAGRNPLALEELLRLQQLVIGDSRFVQLGLRDAGGFIGRRERDTGAPLPEHISAGHEDLPELIEGLVAFGSEPSGELDPVIAAACLAFGFVYIHPFEDGNGRIHRYLIHHVLAEQSFNPPEFVFPVSSVMLREIDTYRSVLETHSRAVLPFIEWRATDQQNVEVLDDTADFYRFFDATPHAEFLYHCVEETIEKDLPQETGFLESFDRFAAAVQEIVDMPADTIDLLFRFLRQNGGRLSERARKREFGKLDEREVTRIESIYADEVNEA